MTLVRGRPFISALLIYSALAGALLWWTLGGSSRAIVATPPAGDNDALSFVWNGWWMQHALSHGKNPFFCDMIFAPRGAPLVFHSFDLFQSTLMAAVGAVSSPWAAFNLTVGVGLVLAGAGAYSLCWYVTRNHAAAVVGGLTFLLSPFIMSRVGAGWLNMLYAGVLPLFLVALLHALDGGKHGSWLLAGAWLFVLSTSLLNGVFAANIAVVVIAWQLITKRSMRSVVSAVMPAALVSLPVAGLLFYYVTTYGLSSGGIGMGRYSNLPEPISYILPFSPNSAYSSVLHRTGHFHRDLSRADNAVYLGLLVFPLALAGFWRARHIPVVRLLACVLALFLVLSLGQVLLIHRTPARLFGMPLYLPFVIWREIPLLGIVWQAGRYLVIAYCMVAVGISLLIGSVRTRAAAFIVGALVCVDYMPRLTAAPLPDFPAVTLRDQGNVLDSRRFGLTMYYQMQHGRPLVGGYISRNPARVLNEYRSIEGMDCLFWGENCAEQQARRAASKLSVSYVYVSPDDRRSKSFESFGFEQIYRDAYTEIWRISP